MTEPSSGPLAGIRIVDASNLIAAPMASTFLADFGAEVIKLEHPQGGDSLRTHGALKDGEPLWWKYLGRNKRNITLYLGAPEGRDIFLDLIKDADVVVENYRPGTMERWGLGYQTLAEVNPRLVVAHVTGFGQEGPLSHRAGFGTIAECMSGFAHRNGYPDGSPTLPPFGLADTVTGMLTAYGIMVALWERQTSGKGQEIDVALIESLLHVLEPQILEYDQFGTAMGRMGNHNPLNAPRNIYETADHRWVAISASTFSTAARLLQLVGRPDMTEEPWFESAYERSQHVELIDEAVGGWIGSHSHDEVVAACDEAGAPCARIYSAKDIVEDEQFAALESIVTVEDPVLGPIRMPNVAFRLSRTPGKVRWPGAALGQFNDEVFEGLGLSPADREKLRERGVL
jgi:crotonobetainyl-CoA:carnitine CoA-transferase CaiB-like acyl-CoA transferase